MPRFPRKSLSSAYSIAEGGQSGTAKYQIWHFYAVKWGIFGQKGPKMSKNAFFWLPRASDSAFGLAEGRNGPFYLFS
jgi:hypothetical protein